MPSPSRTDNEPSAAGAGSGRGTDKPFKNPPRRGRRGRGAAAPAHATAPGPAEPEAPEETPARRRRTRSMVCPACGKFFDITSRTPGSHFDCYCGRNLRVPDEPPPPPPTLRGAQTRLRLVELRRRNRASLISLLVAFAVCIALLSACLFLIVQEQRFYTGTCAGLMGLAFLGVAVVATGEYRRTKSEIAGELVEGDEA